MNVNGGSRRGLSFGRTDARCYSGNSDCGVENDEEDIGIKDNDEPWSAKS